MHLRATSLVVASLLLPLPAAAQRVSPEAERATREYRAGWELMRAEAFAEAARRFQQAANIDPKFVLAYYSLGRAQMNLKRFEEAVRSYEKAKTLHAARVGEAFSDQLSANRVRDEQILQYKEALRQANVAPAGTVRSQTTSMYQQHLQQELRALEEAKNRNQGAAMDALAAKVPFYISMSLGAAYFRTNQFVEAEREYKAALEDNPNSGETHNNLAVLYLLTNRFADAARSIELAEKTGYKVNPGLKDDLKAKMGR